MEAGRGPTEHAASGGFKINISKLGEQFWVFQQVPLGAIVFQGKVAHNTERSTNIAGCLPKLTLFSFALLV